MPEPAAVRPQQSEVTPQKPRQFVLASESRGQSEGAMHEARLLWEREFKSAKFFRRLYLRNFEDFYIYRNAEKLRKEMARQGNGLLTFNTSRKIVEGINGQEQAGGTKAMVEREGRAATQRVREQFASAGGISREARQVRVARGSLQDALIKDLILNRGITTSEEMRVALQQFVEKNRNSKDPAFQQFTERFTRQGDPLKRLAEMVTAPDEFLQLAQAVRGELAAGLYTEEQIALYNQFLLGDYVQRHATESAQRVSGKVINFVGGIVSSPSVAALAVCTAGLFMRPLTSKGVRAGLSLAGGAVTVAGAAALSATFAYFRGGYEAKKDVAAARAARELNERSEGPRGPQKEMGRFKRTVARVVLAMTKKQMQENARRLQQTEYNMATVNQLLLGGGERLGGGQRKNLAELLSDPTSENIDQLITGVGEILARLNLRREGKGTITFESASTIQHDQHSLESMANRVLQELQDRSSNPNEQLRAIQEATSLWEARLLADIADKDKLAKKYERRKGRQAALSAGISSLTFGLVDIGAQAGIEGLAQHFASHETAASVVQQLQTLQKESHGKPVVLREGNLTFEATQTPDHQTLITVLDNKIPNSAPASFLLAQDHQGHEVLVADTKISDQMKADLRAGQFKVEDMLPGNPQTADVPGLTGVKSSIPAGTKWVPDSAHPGAYDLVTVDGKTTFMQDVKFSGDGHITHYELTDQGKVSLNVGEWQQDPNSPPESTIDWFNQNKSSVNFEWYGNNTPSVYDFNELKLYDTRVGQNGVNFNMLSMDQSWQNGNFPDPVNVPNLIQDTDAHPTSGNAFAAFAFYSPNDPSHPLIIEATHGQITLDPTSHADVNVWQDGHWVAMPESSVAKTVLASDLDGFTHASTLTGHTDILKYNCSAGGMFYNQDTKQWTFGSFATAVGTGHPGGEIQHGLTSITSNQGWRVPVPTAPVVAPPPVGVFPITTPITPRRLDERTAPEKQEFLRSDLPGIPEYFFGYPPEYGQGYPGSSRDSVEDYVRWIKNIGYYPKEHPYKRDGSGKWVNIDGTEIVRDGSREREAMKQYLASQPSEYRQMIEGHARTLQPMRQDCRVAIQIPAYLEERNIYHTLEEWASQVDNKGAKINPDLYEIDIIVNGPQGYTKDDTAAEIRRFKRDHPEIHINFIEVEIPIKGGNVGQARKIITDLILQRASQRSSQTGPLYIESEDADLMEIDKRAIYRLIKKFDEEPYIDALRGKQDLAPRILMQNDYLFFDRRVERFVEYLFRDYRLNPENNPNFDFYWNRNITGGWNTAFTAEAYAMIGGYQPARVGEDVDIGRRISIMRGKTNTEGRFIPNVHAIGRVHNVGQSNPRRFINALFHKMPAYADYTNEEINREIRTLTLDQMIERLNFGERLSVQNKKEFETILTNARRFISWKVKDPSMQELLFSRLMTALGFGTYKVTINPDGSQGVTSSNKVGHKGESDERDWQLDYHIEEKSGEVVIDNIENLRLSFEDYRSKNRVV